MGIVYMLSYGDMTYIGSTIMSMNKRMNSHRIQCKRWLEGNTDYCSSYDIIKNENYELLIIEEVKKETVEECREREQWWIEFYEKDNLVNKCNANGLDLENKKIYSNNYREENKEKKAEYNKQHYLKYYKKKRQNYLENKDIILQQIKEYYSEKKDIILQKRKEYYLKNKDKILQYKKEYNLKNKDKN